MPNRRSKAATTIQRAFRRYRKRKHAKTKRSAGRFVRPRNVRMQVGRILPNKARIVLPYHAFHSVTQTDPVVSTLFKYRLDSIFDPDEGGGGHQPMGHDQWAALYKRYRVTKCVVMGTIYLRTQLNDQDVFIFLQADANVRLLKPVTPFNTAIESGRYKRIRIQSNAGNTSYLKQIRTFKMVFTPKAIVHKTFPQSDNPMGWSDFAGNPVWDDFQTTNVPPKLECWVASGNTRAALSAVLVKVDLHVKYFCDLQDPLTLAGS